MLVGWYNHKKDSEMESYQKVWSRGAENYLQGDVRSRSPWLHANNLVQDDAGLSMVTAMKGGESVQILYLS